MVLEIRSVTIDRDAHLNHATLQYNKDATVLCRGLRLLCGTTLKLPRHTPQSPGVKLPKRKTSHLACGNIAAKTTWTRLGAFMVACAAVDSSCMILQNWRF